MRFVVFGLTVTSSWGNRHAVLWRSLFKAMSRRGHTVTFYEKNVPCYADNRDDWVPPPGIRVRLYRSLLDVVAEAVRELDSADVALCTSYCPDGRGAAHLILDSRAGIKAFYDLDTPVTLKAFQAGATIPYLPADGFGAFDLVLSFVGGRALDGLQSLLRARRVAPLYGSVDPEMYGPVAPMREFRGVLSCLGDYAPDRQNALGEFFMKPASRMPKERFVIAGEHFPESVSWLENILFVRSLPTSLHSAFFCSSRATLNVTGSSVAEYGFCPSERLFEAAACRTAIICNGWEGLDSFFSPGTEIFLADSAEDVERALSLSDDELHEIGSAARLRVLERHTASRRVMELEAICESVRSRQPGIATAA